MQQTNIYNLPESIFNAVFAGTQVPAETVIRVTELIGPPLQRQLKMQHWNDLEDDASMRLWSLLGQSMHYILGNFAPKNAIAEERISIDMDGVTITGQPDLYEGDGKITDWKVTSVWSFLSGVKPEWQCQLNVYAFLYRQLGFEIKELWINAILRDWQKGKVKADPDYPKIPFQAIRVPLWTEEEQLAYIRQRIALHKNTAVEPCTESERWRKPTRYAVKKIDGKRATSVQDTEEAAKQYLAVKVKEKDWSKYVIETRPGEDVRCKEYCIVAECCPFNIYREWPE